MIVTTAQLAGLPVPVTMVDGGFDPIHEGHVRYFAAAAALGDPVLCNVSSDRWVGRKHPPLLDHAQRGAVLDAFRDIAYTHRSEVDTVEVLRVLRPRRYAKGADWAGRLPAVEAQTCAELGIEVVYLDTVTNSSTRLLAAYRGRSEVGA